MQQVKKTVKGRHLPSWLNQLLCILNTLELLLLRASTGEFWNSRAVHLSSRSSLGGEMQRFCPQRLTKSLVRSIDTLKEKWGCRVAEREVFAGAKLYMAVILRTGRSFLPLEDCTTTVLLTAQKFLTNCRARPNGSEMGRVLRMRDDGMDHWWQSAHVAQVWPRGVLGWHTVSVVPMESSCGAGSWRSRAKKSLSRCRTAHRDTVMRLLPWYSPVVVEDLKIQSGQWQKFVFLLLRYGFREYRGLLKQTEVRRWKMYLRDLQDEDFEIAIKVEDSSHNPNRPANHFAPWPFLAL